MSYDLNPDPREAADQGKRLALGDEIGLYELGSAKKRQVGPRIIMTSVCTLYMVARKKRNTVYVFLEK